MEEKTLTSLIPSTHLFPPYHAGLYLPLKMVKSVGVPPFGVGLSRLVIWPYSRLF